MIDDRRHGTEDMIRGAYGELGKPCLSSAFSIRMRSAVARERAYPDERARRGWRALVWVLCIGGALGVMFRLDWPGRTLPSSVGPLLMAVLVPMGFLLAINPLFIARESLKFLFGNRGVAETREVE